MARHVDLPHLSYNMNVEFDGSYLRGNFTVRSVAQLEILINIMQQHRPALEELERIENEQEVTAEASVCAKDRKQAKGRLEISGTFNDSDLEREDKTSIGSLIEEAVERHEQARTERFTERFNKKGKLNPKGRYDSKGNYAYDSFGAPIKLKDFEPEGLGSRFNAEGYVDSNGVYNGEGCYIGPYK